MTLTTQQIAAAIKEALDADQQLRLFGYPLLFRDEAPERTPRPYAVLRVGTNVIASRSSHSIYRNVDIELVVYAESDEAAGAYLDLLVEALRKRQPEFGPETGAQVIYLRLESDTTAKVDHNWYEGTAAYTLQVAEPRPETIPAGRM